MKKVFILLLLSSSVFADCTVPEIIVTLRPGASFSIIGNDFSNIIWQSTQTIPSQSEVTTAITNCQNQITLDKTNIQNDIFNLTLSTNTPTIKLPYLLDLLQRKGITK